MAAGTQVRKSHRFSPRQSDRYIGFEMSIGEMAIPPYHYFESFTFSFGTNSDWSGKIVLFDPDWDYLEGLIIEAQASRVKDEHGRMSFSFGWNDQLAGPYHSGILSYAPSFSNDGVTLELSLCHPTTITRNSEVWSGSWPPNTSASQIVRDLLPHLGKNLTGYVIEDSRPYTSGPVLMPKQHPVNWIKKQFCGLDADKPPISASRGVGGYELTIDTNSVLRFHTPGYKGKVVPIGGGKEIPETRGLARSYIFAKGAMGQVISFNVGDLSKFCHIQGAGASGGNAVDIKGKNVRKSGYSNDGRSRTEATPQYTQHAQTAALGARDGRLTHHDPRPYRDKKALDEMIQARYDFLANSTYTADLTVLGDPFINFNDFVEVTVLKRDHSEHYTSGVYRVNRVEHQINNGDFTTSMSLQKASARTAASAFDDARPMIPQHARRRAEARGGVNYLEARDAQAGGS